MSKDTGGPAFPVTPTDNSGQIAETYLGMSLRDWYAGQALSGLLANALVSRDGRDSVTAAFELADTMLAERNK